MRHAHTPFLFGVLRYQFPSSPRIFLPRHWFAGNGGLFRVAYFAVVRRSHDFVFDFAFDFVFDFAALSGALLAPLSGPGDFDFRFDFFAAVRLFDFWLFWVDFARVGALRTFDVFFDFTCLCADLCFDCAALRPFDFTDFTIDFMLRCFGIFF